MLTYCVLKRNNSKNDIRIVETGFSILAFIFGPFWGLFKALWLYSFTGIILLIIVKFLLNNYNLAFFYLPSIISSIFWGVFARDLYIQYLIKNEFKPIKHINAVSKEIAIIKFLSEEN